MGRRPITKIACGAGVTSDLLSKIHFENRLIIKGREALDKVIRINICYTLWVRSTHNKNLLLGPVALTKRVRRTRIMNYVFPKEMNLDPCDTGA